MALLHKLTDYLMALRPRMRRIIAEQGTPIPRSLDGLTRIA